jgi:hypothetical protein
VHSLVVATLVFTEEMPAGAATTVRAIRQNEIHADPDSKRAGGSAGEGGVVRGGEQVWRTGRDMTEPWICQ